MNPALIIFCAQTLPWLAGGFLVVLALVLFIFRRPKVWEAIFYTASVSVLAWIISAAIKMFYQNPRPLGGLFAVPDPNTSFPSEHAAFFFGLALGLYHYDRRLGNLFTLIALVISVARVLAGVHWPTDILGGLAVAFLAAGLVRLVSFSAPRVYNRR